MANNFNKKTLENSDYGFNFGGAHSNPNKPGIGTQMLDKLIQGGENTSQLFMCESLQAPTLGATKTQDQFIS